MTQLRKRDFLAAGLGVAAMAGAARAQGAMSGPAMMGPKPAPMPPPVTNVHPHVIPHRMVKTTRLFKSPPGYANGLAVAPEGLWIGQQKLSGEAAKSYHLPEPDDLHEAAWLVDWNGKLLKTVLTNSRNTSGMAYGNGCVWMMANQTPEGVFQVDMESRQISHRQIPLGLPGQGWRRQPWRPVARRQIVDRRQPPASAAAGRPQDLGARDGDPDLCDSRKAALARHDLRWRRQYLAGHRQ